MSINTLTKHLKLSHIRKNYPQAIQEALNLSESYEEFLEKLLQAEFENRKSNRIQRLITGSKLSNRVTFDDYLTAHLDPKLRKKITELKELRFIEQKENLILIGNSGVGKTYLANTLGMEAYLAGKSVLFISIPNLVIELKEAMSANQLTYYKRCFSKYDLVILDELGYVSFDQVGSEILFNLLSNKNTNGSMIITTNIEFERWEETFKDPMLTAAIVDRIAHRAHVLDFSGSSFRVEDTKQWLR
ncbi:IS21-like element helper ATPase IstB [Enterococcus sp. OL5]|uniref:IS21-like element helper ATPase IstB n=1 Tax=Enterococcus sp. OL5 TaxID=2590214 RepID=UPI0011298BF7|nr:IS21-like element helper ATPase IstB [Enterococcus sp. OL5]TPR56910.1 AAA family ATPase [Enterococcus sp. OL5]